MSFANQNHPDLPLEYVRSYGIWKGIRRQVSGHYHWPEIDIASVSYSDDEGQNWQACDGELMGWFDRDGVANGYGGITACDEPSVIETRDGRVLFLARSTVGAPGRQLQPRRRRHLVRGAPYRAGRLLLAAARDRDPGYRRPALRLEPDLTRGDPPRLPARPAVRRHLARLGSHLGAASAIASHTVTVLLGDSGQ